MRSTNLKINFRHMKREIEDNYFHYLDVFYKCLAVNVIVYSRHCDDILSNTLLENYTYHSFLKENVHLPTQTLIGKINPTHNTQTFLDMQVYLDELFSMRHVRKGINIYCLTIDDQANVIVTLKQVNTNVTHDAPV